MKNKNDTYELRELAFAEIARLGLLNRTATTLEDVTALKKYNDLDRKLYDEASAEATDALAECWE